MDIHRLSFQQLLKKYDPIIKKQIKHLNMYGYYDELYHVGTIALWKASTNFNPDKGNFTSFAQKYIKGDMLKFFESELRFQKRFTIGLEPELIENLPGQNDQRPISFPDEQIKAFLSKSERIWFTEFYENGKKQKEIAKQYQVSVNTVKTWRKRALEKMSENLNANQLRELLDHLNH